MTEALADMTSEDEERSALDLARRRWPRVAGLDPVTRRRRLGGLLARRGYSSHVVLGVVATLEAEAEEEGSLEEP